MVKSPDPFAGLPTAGVPRYQVGGAAANAVGTIMITFQQLILILMHKVILNEGLVLMTTHIETRLTGAAEVA